MVRFVSIMSAHLCKVTARPQTYPQKRCPLHLQPFLRSHTSACPSSSCLPSKYISKYKINLWNRKVSDTVLSFTEQVLSTCCVPWGNSCEQSRQGPHMGMSGKDRKPSQYVVFGVTMRVRKNEGRWGGESSAIETDGQRSPH